MFKKELGISIYPEKSNWQETEKYLIMAKQYGFTRLFMSWMQLKNQGIESTNIELYKQTIKKAKDLGYYVVLDIVDNRFNFYQSLEVDCVRLDTPATPQEVSTYTHQTNLDIQINMSLNDLYVNNLMEWYPVKENIYGCHNFYPLINTGLTWNFFINSTKRFNELGIHSSAFVTSLIGENGPHIGKSPQGLSTLELTRFLPIKTQAKYLLASNMIDCIYIANQFASEKELKSLAELNTKEIEFDIELKKEINNLENNILFKIDHLYRPNGNSSYIRSSISKTIYKNDNYNEKDLESINPKHVYNKGDILIFNQGEPQYAKELVIIKENNTYVPHANWIASIKNYDLGLLDLINFRQRFRFKIIK